MKKSEKDSSGTSFHGHVIVATVTQLKKIIGEPDMECNDGSDKVNFDWTAETEDGEVFTVYDWKEYRRISEDEEIEFHIGGHSREVTEKAADELEDALTELEMNRIYSSR